MRHHVSRMLACRTPQLGVHIYVCEKCGLARIVPHSCKSPFCSSCGKARTDQWCSELLSELLEVPYRHLTFTLPWQIRLPIQDNRERLLQVLCRACADTLLALTYGHPRPLSRKALERLKRMAPERRYRPGIILVIHTFGSDLKWNVHLHVIVTCGGLSEDGTRFVEAPEKSLVSAKELATEWKLRVIEGVEKEERKSPLIKRRLRQDRRRRVNIHALLGYIRRLTWHVLLGRSLRCVEETIRYCCRYTKRPVIAEYRIVSYREGYVTYRYKDYYQDAKPAFKKLPVLEFIDRLVQHIPEKYARQVRYYGIFSTRTRSQDLPKARQALAQHKKRRPRPVTWKDRRAQAGEKRPLHCPSCRVPLTLVAILFGAPQFLAELLQIRVDQRIPSPCFTTRYSEYVRYDRITPLPSPRHAKLPPHHIPLLRRVE